MSSNPKQPLLIGRHLIVMVGFFCFVIGVSGRLLYLQLEQTDFLQDQGDRRVIRVAEIPAHRGIIKDRNGEPLAVSTPVVSLWANPKQLMTAPEQWVVLAANLGMNVDALTRKLEANRNKQFIYLKRHLSPAVAEQILDLKIPGVHSQEEHRRFYPAGEVASHLVGFTNIDEQGQEGLELAFDSALKGEPGKKRVIKDLRHRVVKDVGLIASAAPGKDITLSIDLRAQYLAYRELLTAVLDYKAVSGSAVAVDISTGEVLAMVNQPSYNPNNRSRNDVPNFRNRALTDVFEPGSTMKPFTVAAALSTGDWQPHSELDTSPGFMRIGQNSIRDMKNYGQIDLTTVLVKSSNVGATKLALSMAPETLSQLFRELGFGQSTGVGFPGESTGYLPSKERWRPIEIATLSYGYGLSVTSLQLAQAYATLGSGGIQRPLSLLKVEGEVAGKQVLDPVVARQVIRMMEGVVSDEGTAHKAEVPGYQVAGKTGTVHKITEHGYDPHRYMALFAGVAPAKDPKIALVVIIDDPKGNAYYGGQVAAPVFSRVMAGLLRVQNVPPDKPADSFAGLPAGGVPRS